MIVAVTANGKTARLEDPKVKPLAAPVSKLLTEAAIPPGKLLQAGLAGRSPPRRR